MWPNSAALFERALQVIPGGVNSPVRAFRAVGGNPFFARSASGACLFDVDGNRYVDYVCTWGPAILGHAAEPVRRAVSQALESGTSFGVPGPLEVEMAETIVRWVPSVEKVRMCNSGTEATMSCIRLARGFTGRDKIIKFEGCYHGHVDSLLVKAGSGALTFGQPDSAGIPVAFATQTLTLPFNNPARLKTAFQEHGDELAAVILEPIPANAGLIPPHPEFLHALRTLCDHYGTLLVFDEVMTGFRLARGGAQELLGITPDLSAFGKVIGGGLPVGAFGGRAGIMDHLAPLGPVYQAGTLSGNPLAMAAGLAQLRELEARDGFRLLEESGAALESGLRGILARWGKPFQLIRRGSMFCLFFTAREIHNLDDAKTSDTALFARFFHNLLREGVYFPPSQFETCFLSLAHGSADIEATLLAVEKALP
ncbi:MAG: glutamate-1-semialdehyde 2,1-aminomutase [Candidatus Methylacidiphilales bacterium]|nr:glutamate-1-semialdehyde 2,1-aminomutase [Candidatus Methylacidiphilales bacterium]